RWRRTAAGATFTKRNAPEALSLDAPPRRGIRWGAAFAIRRRHAFPGTTPRPAQFTVDFIRRWSMPLIRYWRPTGGVEPALPSRPTVRQSYGLFNMRSKEVEVDDPEGTSVPDLYDAGGGIGIQVKDENRSPGVTDLEGNDMVIPVDFAAYTVMCLRLLYA